MYNRARRPLQPKDRHWAYGILSGLLLFATTAAANETSGVVSESEFLADIPVVLSATRLAQSRSETPAAITLIDREMIEASGVRQIADLFRLVPGFQVGYEFGSKPRVTYHGLSDEFPRRMQVLVDGRSVYSPFFGGVFWADLPLAIEDIERIEVIRGPNAAVYGSNAVLGTINILTRHASQDPGTLLSVTGGDHAIRDGLARHVWVGDNHETRATVGYRADDGFNNRTDWHRLPYFNARSEIKTSTTDAVEMQVGVSHSTQGEGIDSDPTRPPHEYSALNHYEQLEWRRELAGERFGIRLYHNYREVDEDYLTDPLADLGGLRVPVNLDATEERYDLELQHNLVPEQRWRLVWGAGARLDRVQSPTWFSTTETLNNKSYRVFGNVEWRATAAAIVNAGAMLENSDVAGTDTSPRLALNYNLTPGHTLRLAASRGYRTPELLEVRADKQYFYNDFLLDQELVGNEQLEPERITAYEAGYAGQLNGQRLNWDVRVYRDEIQRFVTWVRTSSTNPADPNGYTGTLINAGDITIDGVDLQLEYRPLSQTRLLLTHAYMHADASDTGSADSVHWNEQAREDSVPTHSSSVLISQKLPGEWQGSIMWYHVSYMRWLGYNFYAPAHGRYDLRLAKKVYLMRAMSQVALVVQNVGDEHYVDFVEDSVADRRFFLTIGLDLN